MVTAQEHAQLVNTLSIKTDKILNREYETYHIRKQQLGEYLNFEPLRYMFQQMEEYAGITKDLITTALITRIPHQLVIELVNKQNELEEVIESIAEFHATDPNAAQTRENLLKKFTSRFQEYSLAVANVNLHGTFWKDNSQEEKLKAQLIVEEIEAIKGNLSKVSGEAIEEITKALSAVKTAAGTTGINQYSNIFKEESVEFETKAETALSWLIGMLICTGIVAVILLVTMPELTSPSSIVQYSITKVVVLLVLFYIVSILNRNYKAYKHNSIVNKHRQNALMTFEAFVQASSDEQTKNAVLLKATESIFNSQTSGYTNPDNDTDMSSKVIEIIKSSPSKQG